MDRGHVIDALNCILRTLQRSLPRYVQEGRRLWWPAGSEPLRRVLAEIAAEQQSDAARIGALICQQDGCAEPGHYSLDFTSMNDVSLTWLWHRVIELQERDLECLERCCGDLTAAPEAQRLVNEVLGHARGHLQKLREAAHAPAHVAR